MTPEHARTHRPGGGSPIGRLRLAAITIVMAMVVTALPWAGAVQASILRRSPTRRRPPRPVTRPLRPAAPDGHRGPPGAHRRAHRFLQPIHVAVPHGRSRRRLRLLVPRHRPLAAVVHHTVRRPPRRPGHGPLRPVTPSIRAIILAAAHRHHVSASWLLQVAVCESGLDPFAYNPSSGASGLFQFMPSTFFGNGGHDLWNPFQQSDVAATMFAEGESSAWACA